MADGWYPDAALAIEFDGRVKYRRPRYGRTPEDELWREKRNEDLLRSLGVRFVRVAAEDMTSSRRVELRPSRAPSAGRPKGRGSRAFSEIPRAAGRWRGAGHR